MKPKKKKTEKWTTIAVREKTHSRLESMKMVKSPGKMENFDDVISRSIGLEPEPGNPE